VNERTLHPEPHWVKPASNPASNPVSNPVRHVRVKGGIAKPADPWEDVSMRKPTITVVYLFGGRNDADWERPGAADTGGEHSTSTGGEGCTGCCCRDSEDACGKDGTSSQATTQSVLTLKTQKDKSVMRSG